MAGEVICTVIQVDEMGWVTFFLALVLLSLFGLDILMDEDTIRKRLIGHCVTLGNHDGVN